MMYCGQVDVLANINMGLNEARARLHFMAAGGGSGGPPRFNQPQLAGGALTLSWAGQGRLQEATVLTGQASDWTNVTPQPANNTYSTQVTGSMKFYRLVR